jgi:hypothetical protein
MRQGTFMTYPALRRAYKSAGDLGKVINKNRNTVCSKLNKTGFSELEQMLIIADLRRRGVDTTHIFEI